MASQYTTRTRLTQLFAYGSVFLMNTTPEQQKKDSVLKILAIGGLVGLIIIIAWLGIKLVSVLPNAFSSLASLSETVYNYKPLEIAVTSNKDVVNSGDALTLQWNDPKPAGTFFFTYSCVEGIALDIRVPGKGIETISCDDMFELGDISTVDLSMTAEKNRFTEVPVMITFADERQGASEITTNKVITVVNVSIADIKPDTETPVTPAPVVVDPKPTPEPLVTPKPTPAPVPVKPVAPKPVQPVVTKPTYTIPVSNPNGFTDITIRSLGAGTISGNRFVNLGTLNRGQDGAIQFEIKNIGTKTSNKFTFVANLPDGTTYTSPVQAALKPNERAVITLGFTASDEKDIKAFSAIVTVAGDSNLKNNAFSAAVTVK